MTQPRISQLTVYPVKSTTGIHLNHALVELQGLAFDRRFVVARYDGRFVTARSHPRLLQVHSALTENGLHLRAPAMAGLDLIYSVFEADYRPVQVWDDRIEGQYCGDQAAHWFSDWLGEPVQLLYFGAQSSRPRRAQAAVPDGPLSFADAAPLLLISQASLDDLNQRLPRPVRMEQFRPNVVVKDCSAFAEDGWQRIRIGQVEFVLTDPCSRCNLTTIDPDSAVPDPDNQPLATLQQFRRGENGHVFFGQNMVALNRGKLSLYDPIEVLEHRTPPVYRDQAPRLASTTFRPHVWQEAEQALLECVSVRDETRDVKTFSFRLADGLRAEYQSGQFICLELEIDGQPVHRNYTLSSSPSRPDLLAITVKRVEGGLVSNWLNDRLRVGDRITARAPAGDFHIGAAPHDKLLLISAGSGITPMLSMLRWMVDQQLANDVVFVHSGRSQRDLIAYEELLLLARQHGHCQLIFTLTQPQPGDLRCYRGRIDRMMLESVAQLPQRQTFVCGPHPFMEKTKALLLKLGLPEEHYFEESFGVRDGNQGPAAASLKSVKLLFDSWDALIEGDNQRTLLEQAEKAGLSIPFSCRGGFCGSCRVKLESGTVEQLESAGLSDAEREEGYVLACSCRPTSDLVITQG